jgi:hypothetical protein
MGLETTEEMGCIRLIVAGVILGATNSGLAFKISKKMEPAEMGESLILRLFVLGLNQIG